MADWSYGDSWERYPIEAGEPWMERSTGSQVAVYDLFDGFPAFMTHADMIYVDPPWNTGNIRSFYTKAGMPTKRNFRQFLDVLFGRIKDIDAPVCYMEMGKQNRETVINTLQDLYASVQFWEVIYYRKNPSFLIRAAHTPTDTDFTGIDDMHTPRMAMETELFSCVADLCMGRGLTATTAYRLGKQFVGTELNKRRLAVTIDKIAKLGGDWCTTQH